MVVVSKKKAGESAPMAISPALPRRQALYLPVGE